MGDARAGHRWPSKLHLTARSSRLAAGVAAAGLAWGVATSLDPLGRQNVNPANVVDGVVRSSRAVYTITYIVVDYKYSLRNFQPNSSEYRMKLSQVHLRSAKKLLKLCEVNRGFYVKAGQFVSSMRQVPKEYTSVLSSLQNQAIPSRFKDIQEVISKNLGKDLSEIFLTFDEEPFAAASIAQVHRAFLKDSQEVAVKVQHPGLEQRMKIDITTMFILSKSVSWFFPDYRFDRIVSEFDKVISMELDFLQEANNSERVAKNFRNNSFVKVPRIFWDLTTGQVLTMEYCDGHKVDDVDFMKDSGINPKKVADALMEIFAEMIFVHGFLHGDPHPGNILVAPRGHGGFSIDLSNFDKHIFLRTNQVLLDHGIYRELNERFRLDYCELWKALITLDAQKIQHLGEKFGVGKYSKYFPVIFTGRTIESKSALGMQMSNAEKKLLKQELHSLKIDDISLFMESLPPEFLTILRTDGLLRSLMSKLGASRSVRLLAYAKYALYGLETESRFSEDVAFDSTLSRIRANISYFKLRTLLEILALLSRLDVVANSIAKKTKRILQKVRTLLYSFLPATVRIKAIAP